MYSNSFFSFSALDSDLGLVWSEDDLDNDIEKSKNNNIKNHHNNYNNDHKISDSNNDHD